MSDRTIEALGTILDATYKRDAVHVAVIPLFAAEPLKPGMAVGLVDGDKMGICDKPLGIVDPFLPGPVYAGQRCFLFLFPQTITSLRHVWTHPDFPEEIPGEKPKWTKKESEEWLREFADTADCPRYDILIAAASGEEVDDVPSYAQYGDSYENDGEYLHFNGRDAHGDIPDEFWDHLENLTGKKLRRAKYFSCSC